MSVISARVGSPAPLATDTRDCANACAIAADAAFSLRDHGVAMLPAIAAGVPAPALPDVTIADVRDLAGGALALAFLTFAEGILLAWKFTDDSEVGAVTVERSPNEVGPWEPVAVAPYSEDGFTKALDPNVEADETYYYRLSVMDHSGKVSNYGMVAASHTPARTAGSVLMAPSPNPAKHGTSLSFRISQPEFVRLSIVDATGRQVRVLQNAMMAPGTHTMAWDGSSESGERVAPGLYFVTLRTSAGMAAQRLAVVR